MPRQRKPTWVNLGPGRPGRFKTKIDGQIKYFPVSIKQHDRPQYKGIPEAAWEYLRGLEREADEGTRPAADPTVEWLIEIYLAWGAGEVAAGRMSGNHYGPLSSRLKLFTDHPEISRTRATALTVDMLAEFFSSLRGRGYEAHYIAGVGRSIRAAFRWAARPVPGRTPTRLIPENPLAGYEFPRAPGAVRGYIEGEVVRRFLRWAWGRARSPATGTKPGSRRFDRLFVLMLRFQRLTGCRPGEACDLRWSDIDREAGKITIPAARQKMGKATGRDRVIYLTRPVVRMLDAIGRMEGHHPEYVFTHMRGRGASMRGHGCPLAGEPWPSGSAASAKVRKLRELAISEGLPGLVAVGAKKLVAYSNRHGYVSEAISLGLTHEQTAGLVGNSAGILARTYAHALERADADRAKKLMERGKSGGK